MLTMEEWKLDEPILAVAVGANWYQTHQPSTLCLMLTEHFAKQKGFEFNLKGRRGVGLSDPGW